jgi:hypothetical protein
MTGTLGASGNFGNEIEGSLGSSNFFVELSAFTFGGAGAMPLSRSYPSAPFLALVFLAVTTGSGFATTGSGFAATGAGLAATGAGFGFGFSTLGAGAGLGFGTGFFVTSGFFGGSGFKSFASKSDRANRGVVDCLVAYGLTTKADVEATKERIVKVENLIFNKSAS